VQFVKHTCSICAGCGKKFRTCRQLSQIISSLDGILSPFLLMVFQPL